MAQIKRLAANVTSKRGVGSGVYLARVVSHLDPTFMGALEVTLLREQGNKLADSNQTFIVKYASPFFGSTAFEFMGGNVASKSNTLEAYNDTQKSYGMWFVPPDVGVTVLVVFVDENPADGYWIGCVPPRFANNMVPGIAASENIDIDTADKRKFNTDKPLPVAEINKRINSSEQRIDTDKIKKPVHPIADRFLEQGLLEDDIRGYSTSSARREVPSSVYGISTPGPLDKRPGAKRVPIGKLNAQTQTAVPVSRLGGTQLVFDDGDDRYQRKKSAGELGQEGAYADILNKEKGDPTIPSSEFFRVRTRTGHQILLHNSEDLIYIGNARGTAWIELTSNGKIDIYSQDSISIHTENDLNIRADRDINMEAGRNINFRTETGRWHADIATDLEFYVANDAKITIDNNLDIKIGVDTKITTGSNYDLKVGADTKITTGSNYDLKVGADTKILTTGNFNVKSDGSNRFTAGKDTDFKSGGNHTETATKIDMNSALAEVAVAAEEALDATPIAPLELKENLKTSNEQSWDKRYKDGNIRSIMKRIPMHEPWSFHENLAPDKVTPALTDRDQ
jgi:hypothetical protein